MKKKLKKKLYLFDKHRISFYCLVKSFQEELIKKDNLLITLDGHCDLYISDHYKENMSLAKQLDLFKIKENILGDSGKQDWMLLLIESGIVKDIVIIGPNMNINIEPENFPKGLPKEYIDSGGVIHKIFYFEDIFSFEKNFIFEKDINFIFDIDFDYFFSINQFRNKSNKLSYKSWFCDEKIFSEMNLVFKEGTKLRNIYESSKIITLAQENEYTFSHGEKWSEKFIEIAEETNFEIEKISLLKEFPDSDFF